MNFKYEICSSELFNLHFWGLCVLIPYLIKISKSSLFFTIHKSVQMYYGNNHQQVSNMITSLTYVRNNYQFLVLSLGIMSLGTGIGFDQIGFVAYTIHYTDGPGYSRV